MLRFHRFRIATVSLSG
jgi:hypothetical protein